MRVTGTPPVLATKQRAAELTSETDSGIGSYLQRSGWEQECNRSKRYPDFNIFEDERSHVTDVGIVLIFKERKMIRKNASVASISQELQSLQRQRAWYLKSRNMIANRLQATVAGTLNYHASMPEKERLKLFKEATVLIDKIVKEEMKPKEDGLMSIPLVKTTAEAIAGFNEMKKDSEKKMVVLAQILPVAEWVGHVDQRGFGILFLGIIIGETGDLANYANPAKVWRRLGCAPFTKDNETLMGATWKSRGGRKKGQTKLHAEEWEEFGYSPRRRSISYLIGEGIVKLNRDGPYRARYDEAKALAVENHPDWTKCPICKGTKKSAKGGKCSNCKGTGIMMKHCHLHGMLLATKLLLKNLWIEWNNGDKDYDWKKHN